MIKFLKHINTNLLVAASAVVISLCALIISIQEVRIMRSQQKAAMFPYLSISKSYNSEGFGMLIYNNGNGLAKIESYQISYQGKTIHDWVDGLNTLAPEAKNINYNIVKTSGDIHNEMIVPGAEINLIFMDWTAETRQLEKKFHDIQVRVCYSSLLDESWIITEQERQQVESCQFEPGKEFGS
ncbi:hypothetical protein [Marinicella sp. W31]|uniref:hypothetical protein n=1 Tax=Marinicella sp. W31 TaxID=3023713 RepID=UPI003757B5FA